VTSAASWLALGGRGVGPVTSPTRDRVCSVRNRFQGLTVTTQQYGALPGPTVAWLDLYEDRQAVYAAHLAVGDTHVQIPISGVYQHPR
jgi:hypothetical protein